MLKLHNAVLYLIFSKQKLLRIALFPPDFGYSIHDSVHNTTCTQTLKELFFSR